MLAIESAKSPIAWAAQLPKPVGRCSVLCIAISALAACGSNSTPAPKCRADSMVHMQVGSQFWSLPGKQLKSVTPVEGTPGLIKRPDWKPGDTVFCQPQAVDKIRALQFSFEAADRPKSGPQGIGSPFFEIRMHAPYKAGETVSGEKRLVPSISLARADANRLVLGRPTFTWVPNTGNGNANIPLRVDGSQFDPVECGALASSLGSDGKDGPWVVGCRVTLAIDGGNYLTIHSGGFRADDRNALTTNIADGIEQARQISQLKSGN